MTNQVEECCGTCHFARPFVTPEGAFDLTKKICKLSRLSTLAIPDPGAPGKITFIIAARPAVSNVEYCGEWKMKKELRMRQAESEDTREMAKDRTR